MVHGRRDGLFLLYIPIEIVPRGITLLKNLHTLRLDGDSPLSLPKKYSYRLNNIKTYYKELDKWGPEQVVQKIRKNEELSEFDKINHQLGKFVPFILKQTQDVDNEIKRSFLSFVKTKFSVDLNNSDFSIML